MARRRVRRGEEEEEEEDESEWGIAGWRRQVRIQCG